MLTPAQLKAISRMSACSLLSSPAATAKPGEAQQQACLDLGIALLDHRLTWKLTDSILVSFLQRLVLLKTAVASIALFYTTLSYQG
jgi:hypothetical protein